MKESATYGDDMLAEAVGKEYDKAPISPLTKEQAWERLQYELSHMRPPRKASVPAHFRKWAYWTAGAALLITFVLAYGFRGDISFSLTSKQAAGTKSAAEDFTVRREVLKYSSTGPKYVPSGYSFSHANTLLNSDSKNIQVVLIYTDGSSQFSITRFYKDQRPGPDSNTIGSVDKTEESVRSKPADLYKFKDGSFMLVWDEGDVHYTVRGKLTREDILKVADSL